MYPGQGYNLGGDPSASVRPEVQQWFATVDRDRSGRINWEELQAALVNGQGENFSDAACKLMIGMFDKAKSGTVGVVEFQQLFDYINQWLTIFKTYDRDGSGSIEESELSQAFQQMGFRFSGEFVRFLVEKADCKGQRSITVDQFILLCVQIQRFTEAFRSRDAQQAGVITIAFEDFLTVALDCTS